VAAVVLALGATLLACRQKPSEIRITPARSTVYGIDRRMSFQAGVYDRKGNPVPNVTPTWESSRPQIATVDSTGVVKSLASGRTQVTASLEGISGSAAVEVVDVASVMVNPNRTTLIGPKGSASELAVEVKDGKGAVVSLKPRWTTGDAKIALVDPNGVVTSVAEGRTTITASLGDISSVCDVRVLFRDIAVFALSPLTLILHVGESQRLFVVVKDASGILVEDAALAWTSSDPKTAVVSGGLVLATGRGTATITVTAPTKTLQATVLVN
jgi:uncharacterized protein YjdB